MAMIDGAVQTGIKRFVPSEFGWAEDLVLLPELVARLKPKRKVLDYLVQKTRDNQTLAWSAIAAGPFLDWVSISQPIHASMTDINR